MILQKDTRFTDPEIIPYGCHFMAELFLINRCGNIPFSVDIIEQALKDLRIRPASYQPTPGEVVYVVGPQCTINNPDDIVTYFGLNYRSSCTIKGPAYECVDGEQELLQWKRPGWTHWVAGDGKGNVAYDPEGYSVTVAQGQLVAKKIFTIIQR